MIRRISGTVIDITENTVVIDVAGIGYLIHTTGERYELNGSVSFWTHLAVRENALDLYGFSSRDTLEMFSLLLGIPKIGPKSAQQIMTQADIETIKKSVISNDPTYLTKVSGVGKKTAEKIVTELKDKFEYFTGAYDTDSISDHKTNSFTADAIDALVTLGYPQTDARKIVQNLPETITTTNEAVKEALKQLGQA